ncbi:MAG: hypothetical protein KME55_40250 [Nostoc indistinguendum CM1-VF10]|jgi:hypothetical protein|nr:hypothetical protein [Nostoc indistinguendum CM1-VF10]
MTKTQEFPLKNKEVLPIVEQKSEQLVREVADSTTSNKKYFAAMNGVSVEAEPLPQSEVPEPEEIVTTRTIPQNPLLKMAVIGGVILVFIMIIGGLINGSMNALNISTTKIESPKINLETTELSEIVDETGKTKTALL